MSDNTFADYVLVPMMLGSGVLLLSASIAAALSHLPSGAEVLDFAFKATVVCAVSWAIGATLIVIRAEFFGGTP